MAGKGFIHTEDELRQLQALPLDVKIETTLNRVREWVNHFGGEDSIYVSFSGGKDSTVLIDIVSRIYPNIKLVFVDTGLEYPEIRDFVKSYGDRVVWLKPKMNFRKVIDKYGYPFISKRVAAAVYNAKTYLCNHPDDDIETSNSCACKQLTDRYMNSKTGGEAKQLQL